MKVFAPADEDPLLSSEQLDGVARVRLGAWLVAVLSWAIPRSTIRMEVD